jgi:carbamoyltransferase
MEFGQRSLCNRSLLADPTVLDIVPKINTMIKSRDFWMPFAPVILDSYVQKYLHNPKNMHSPYMTIGFETTELGWQCLRFACHQGDRSARPQILRREDNPHMYALLEAFAERTGRGALLNTSFNLHGSPIVRTAQEAYEIFVETDIEGLLLPGFLIMKTHAISGRT